MQHSDHTGPTVLLVLGMHRSGTSAVTGMLDRLGIPAAGELLPAESYNEKGIYENKAVNLFHNRLLVHLGSNWDDPLPVSNRFVATPAGQRFVDELAAIVETELLAGTPVFAVKDPRMCRFIPLWRAVLDRLGAQTCAVVPLRHPLEVAGSLASRDGFPRAKSLLLWLAHALAVESETRGLARSFIGYDRLLADWRGTADKLARDLRLEWPKERGRVESDVDEFLTGSLRHHRTQADIGEGTHLDVLVGRCWSALLRLVEDEADAEARETLDAAARELDAAGAVVGPYVAWEFRALGEARERVGYLEELERVLRAQNADYFHEIAEGRSAAETRIAEAETRIAEQEKVFEERIAALTRSAESARHRLETDHRRLLAHEVAAARAEAKSAAQAEAGREAAGLRHQIGELRREADRERAALHAIQLSTLWRLTGPVRRLLGAVPPSARAMARRSAKAGWWAVTPWRMPKRLEFLRQRDAALASARQATSQAASDARAMPSLPPVSDMQRPLQLFPVRGGQPRLSMVTDSINAGSLFGGVATALIFSALLAERTGRRLRIVTRTQPADAGNVATVFRAHGIAWRGNIEFAFADTHNENSEIDLVPDECFVTTSWWSTEAARASVLSERIVYLLQEDERMFYPMGNNSLACSEILADRSIRKVVNSQLLHRHLAQDGLVGLETPFFEPSFPERIYFPEPRPDGEKRNFFFYARPNNARNLFDRGVAVIEAAIEQGILDPAKWDIHFVGKDLQPIVLAGGVEPILLQNMPWEKYAAYVRSVDLALTLMYTPHPSYPPLDVAACGGVAVTNRFGVKTDLTSYSRSIVCANSDVDSLVEGMRAGAALAIDRPQRERDVADNHIGRDWSASFAPVFEQLSKEPPFVR